MNRSPSIALRPPSLRLAAYTAAVILAGLAALAWATMAIPLAPPIALHAPEIVGREPTGTGLLFWVLLGLAGSLWSAPIGDHAILTLHLPFIVAALLLGGPAAGGWVAFISTIELRELREVPWYGVLANHAGGALAAVVAGLAVGVARQDATTWVSASAADLVAAVAGAAVLGGLSVAIAAGTIGLRERLTIRETLMVLGGSWRRTLLAECVVAWILAFAYQAMGWWATAVCAVLVLLVWESHDDRERVAHDQMTGLLNRHGILARLAGASDRVRRTGIASLLIMLDLDGFKHVNDTLGHAAGDEVLQVVGQRLLRSIRVTDVAARMGGDEFVLLLPDVRDEETAGRLAGRIHAALGQPIAMAEGEVRVGSSLGLVMIDGEPHASPTRLLAAADRAMYEAKRAGGGIHFSGGSPGSSGTAAA